VVVVLSEAQDEGEEGRCEGGGTCGLEETECSASENDMCREAHERPSLQYWCRQPLGGEDTDASWFTAGRLRMTCSMVSAAGKKSDMLS